MRTASFKELALIVGVSALMGFAVGRPAWGQSYPAAPATEANIRELLDTSLRDRRGLTFYINGQTVPGIVTRVTGEIVETRSQMSGRIMIRLDRIDAVSIN